jgi:dienelactone hydrolase
MKRLFLAVACFSLALAGAVSGQKTGETLDTAFAAYWSAADAKNAADEAPRIVKTGAAFDEVLKRLKAGHPYKADEKKGSVPVMTMVDGTRVDNYIEVPESYTPDKKWALRVQLHGGVSRPVSNGRPLTAGRIEGEPQIYLHPRAFNEAEWWRASQVDNVLHLVDYVKRRYNVDESKIYVTGISDGGTGTYFMAMREATLFQACLSLNGHPSVLANPSVGADQQLYITNLVNCPFYAVNGGMDPLYPAASVTPLIDMMKQGKIPVEYFIYPDGQHNTAWWPEEQPRYEKFLAAHPREAHPAKLSWETDRVDRYNRIKWLTIDRLGKRPSDDSTLNDVNIFNGRFARQLYDRDREGGRVDVTRTGNTFDAKTRGVDRFTLLLSPDVVDFNQPVTVTVNGRPAFKGAVKKDVATLMKWAARDNDRTMLYGAEVQITVP